MLPARLEQPTLTRCVQHTREKALDGAATQQSATELAEHAVIEARVGQIERE